MYVLLYSESQRCFHIETVAAMIDKNIRMYLNGVSSDYIALAIGSTVEELRELRNQIIKKRSNVVAPAFLPKYRK